MVRMVSIKRSALAGAFLALTGCSTLFPGLQTGSVKADVDAIILVASNISTWAADAWSVLPASVQTQAATAYVDLQNGLKTTIQTAEDALAVYQASGALPSGAAWATIFAAIENAADAITVEIESLANTTAVLPPSLRGLKPGDPGFADRLPPPVAGRVAQLESARATLHKFKAP
jgi:hypothetical protein